MAEVFIGLGSNLADPAAQLREAVGRLARRLTVERISSAYRTEPVGLKDQPHFLNAVLAARTEMSPQEVLSLLVSVEAAMGRRRDVPQGPRTIDLDLLLYDHRVVDEPDLRLPHPRMSGRRFVLAPLAEIAPGVRPAGAGGTVAELLAALPAAESVERVDLPGWPPPAPRG
jgi:2-amino-4-hydroxy-6-hydroxymethyldihydropteridine diphosphokinase